MSESPRQEADGSTDANDKDFSCPSCDKTLNTERGMKIHHATVHDESLVVEERECAHCGEEFQYRPDIREKYCSKECLTDSQRSQVKRECLNCGDVYETRPSHNQKFCSKDCRLDGPNVSLSGEDHPRYTGRVTVECENCGREYQEIPSRENRTRFCSYDCRSEYQLDHDHPFGKTGEDHPAWNGGNTDSIYYGANWDTQRRKALERDNHSCVICGKSKDELGQNPHIHHIRPFSTFNNYERANQLSNLVCLCPKHHSEWEGLYLKPDVR